MSAQTELAIATFRRLIQDAVDLIALSAARGKAPGRRREEMSLNRGAVVLAVAAWQTFVEETTRGALDTIGAGASSPLFKLIKADTLSAIGRFNTPNSRNSLDLFLRVGFDPSPHWNVNVRWVLGRYANGRTVERTKSFTPAEAQFELDAWLQVRHLIAHGRPFDATNVQLKSVLTGRAKSGLTLWRADAERCIAFMDALTAVTRAEATVQFP